MKKYVNASAIGKPEIDSISLKSLYDSGVHFLNFGGEIVKTGDNGEEYYDLYSQNTGELFVSDGEMVEFTKHYNISTGLPYWVATTDDGKDIYLTNDEYRIAVYHNNYNIKSSTAINSSEENYELSPELSSIIDDYAGHKFKNPTTGWTGYCDAYLRELSDGAILISLIFGENESEPDEFTYNPETGKSVFYPYHGTIVHTNSLDELRNAMRKEYSYLKRVD